MATIEVTGAENVAWDLSDLFASAEDPKLEQEVAEAERGAAVFRERYHGAVAGLDAAGLAEAVAERERIESAMDRVLTYAHLNFATNMGEPARGALVARLQEKAASLETQLLFFALEWAAVEDGTAALAARGAGARPLASLPGLAAQVPSAPALRARGEDLHRKGRVGLVCLVTAV